MHDPVPQLSVLKAVAPRRHDGHDEVEPGNLFSDLRRVRRAVVVISLPMHEPIPPATERIATHVLDAAFAVHRGLGPGLLESVYETCLCHELRKLGVLFRSQAVLPVVYDGLTLDAGLRLDLFVDECVIVELKAVDKHNPLFDAQILTYLKLAHCRLGLLINFNVSLLKDGIKRFVQ